MEMQIELPTAAASSSPRRLGRSATFNPQRHSSPATAATAQDRALPGRPAQPTSPSTAATAQARAELNGPSVESVPVATTAKEGRADLSSLRGQSGADSAQATAVQGSPLMGSSPQVADAVQRINRATSDLSHSSRRHE